MKKILQSLSLKEIDIAMSIHSSAHIFKQAPATFSLQIDTWGPDLDL